MELSTKERYSRAYVQVLEIMKYIGKEYKEKIPESFLNILERNKCKDYKYSWDDQKKIEEQSLLEETWNILAMIELDYWATPEEKEKLCRALKTNEIEYQNKLNKKYNVDNIFKKRKEQNSENVLNLVEYKEPLLKRIIKKIKNIFNIK